MVVAHFSQLFFYYFQKIFLKPFLQTFYICNHVSVLIFSSFVITAGNKRTNQLMYTYKIVVEKSNAKSRSSYR